MVRIGLITGNYKVPRTQDGTNGGSMRKHQCSTTIDDVSMSEQIGFRPCDNCGLAPSGGSHTADVKTTKLTCTAKQCNRTVRAIGIVTKFDEWDTTSWGPNVNFGPVKGLSVTGRGMRKPYTSILQPNYVAILQYLLGNRDDILGCRSTQYVW